MSECVWWSSCQFLRGLHDFRRWIAFNSFPPFPFSSLPFQVLKSSRRERSGYLPPNRPIFLSPSFPPNPPTLKNPISHFKSPKHLIYVHKPVLFQVTVTSLFYLIAPPSLLSYSKKILCLFETQLLKYFTLLVTFQMQNRIQM